MCGNGSDLWRSSRPTPLLNQIHLEQVAKDHIQVGFKYLQRRSFYNLWLVILLLCDCRADNAYRGQ